MRWKGGWEVFFTVLSCSISLHFCTVARISHGLVLHHTELQGNSKVAFQTPSLHRILVAVFTVCLTHTDSQRLYTQQFIAGAPKVSQGTWVLHMFLVYYLTKQVRQHILSLTGIIYMEFCMYTYNTYNIKKSHNPEAVFHPVSRFPLIVFLIVNALSYHKHERPLLWCSLCGLPRITFLQYMLMSRSRR